MSRLLLPLRLTAACISIVVGCIALVILLSIDSGMCLVWEIMELRGSND